MKLNRWFLAVALLVLARFLAAIVPSIKTLPPFQPGTTDSNRKGHPELTSAHPCEVVRPAVVTLYAGPEFGSGSIITPQGLVLTNHHVVQEASGGVVRARTWEGALFQGRVVATDANNDLALVQLNPTTPLPTVSLAKTTDIRPGQTVCAIGSPFGRTGVIAQGTLTGTRNNGDLQSSILLHPGNSGGPLIDANGDMIGVNKAIWLSETGKNVGIGFATTTAVAQRFIAENQPQAVGNPGPDTDGTPPHDRVGIDLSPSAQEPNGPAPGPSKPPRLGALVDRQSLVIEKVEPGSPADVAGLSAGDRLLAFNGQRLNDVAELRALLNQRPTSAVVTISRNQRQQDVRVGF